MEMVPTPGGDANFPVPERLRKPRSESAAAFRKRVRGLASMLTYNDTMGNIRLLYVSDQTSPVEYADLTSILQTAVEQNTQNAITGVLVATRNAFLQELEGEGLAVSRLFAKILQDPRHTNVELLLVQPFERRSFPDWSMKVIGTSARRQELLEELGLKEGQLRRLTGVQAHQFLLALARWEAEPPHAAPQP